MIKKIGFFMILICLMMTFSAHAQEMEEPIRIAVIDSGISTLAVSESSILGGKNYIRPQDNTQDLIGHGTAVSSLIVGSENAKIEGICPDARLISLVYCTKNEEGQEVRGDTAMAARAIYDAIDVHGCRIINFSAGTPTDSPTLRRAIQYAEEKQVLVVSSAGNAQEKNPNAVYYPGAYESVLCVGAAREDGTMASFSQKNDTVDLLARGTELRLASIRGNRIRGEGTSFATAIVTGAAARILQVQPGLSVQELREAVLQCTQEVDGWKVLDLNLLPVRENLLEESKEVRFEDVPEDAYYAQAVQWAVDQKITGGVDDTHFNPKGTTTRAQMVAFLYRAAGSPESENKTCSFEDVKEGTYYYPAVCWAVEQGITLGTDDTHFSPNASVNRGQAVTFLYRMLRPEWTGTETVPFADVPEGSFCYEAAIWAAQNGVTNGSGTGETFSPRNVCLRSQVVTFLFRACAAKQGE